MDFKQKITEIYQGHMKKGMFAKKFFFFENIPLKKLKNAVEEYASTIRLDETAVCLYDDTAFGSAKGGFILTTQCLYFNGTVKRYPKGSIPLKAITEITHRHVDLGMIITIHVGFASREILVLYGKNKLEEESLFNAFNDAVKFLKEEVVTDDSPPEKNRRDITFVTCKSCGAPNDDSQEVCCYCNVAIASAIYENGV